MVSAAAAGRVVATFADRAGVELVRAGGEHDETGRWTETLAAPVAVTAATAPADSRDARVRALEEDGVRLDAMRRFWLQADIDPAVESMSAGDYLDWDAQRWRVHSVQRWGAFTEALTVRQ